MHFDDDDVYAPHYVATVVHPVAFGGCDISKLSAWLVYDERSGAAAYADYDARALKDAPPSLAPLLERGRDSYGFCFCYRRAYAARHPFPEVGFGEDATFLQDALRRDAKSVCYLRDAGAAVLHVQHGANASRSVALASCSRAFLDASPLSPLAGALKSAEDPSTRGLFVVDAERETGGAGGTAGDDGALQALLDWVSSDAGFAPDRRRKLGL